MANPVIPPLQHPHPGGFVLSIPNNNRSTNPLSSDQHPPSLSVALPHHRQSSRANATTTTTTGAGTRQSSSSSSKDPYYGHEDTAKTCSRAIKHIFGCLDEGVPSQMQHMPTEKSIPLAKFIAYAFHRTRLPPAVAFHALVLLTRLKMRYPNASCAHGHRLFLTSYMLSSKVICDDTYSNKSWAIVGQGFYELRDVNLMEREMISFLAWDITISGPDLEIFMQSIKANYRRPVSKNTLFITVPEVKKLPGNEYFGRGTIVIEEREKKVVPLPEVEDIHMAPMATQVVPAAPRMAMSIVPPTHTYSSPPPLYSPADDGTPSPSSDSGSSGPPSPDGVITPTDDGVSLPNALPVPKHHQQGPHQMRHGGVQVHDGGEENSWGWAGKAAW